MPNPPAKKGIDWKWSFTTGIAVLGLVIGSTWKVHDEFSRIDKRMAKIETAVRIIGAKQGGDTKTLIDEALAVAKNANDNGRSYSAKTVLDIANRLLAEQKVAREPAPQEFFDGAMQKYQALKRSPSLADSVWEGTTKLAEYRSATSPTPSDFQVHIGELSQKGPFRYLRDSYISGANAIAFGDEKGFVLDGFFLESVTFKDTTIIYHGKAPVILRNVRFVNCQFDFRRSTQSEQLLEAAIKEPVVNASIG